MERNLIGSLLNDKAAFISVLYLAILGLAAIAGQFFIGPELLRSNLRMRHAPPFQLDNGWLYFLGADALGKSLILRLIMASATSMGIAFATVVLSLVVGGSIGLIAGIKDNWLSTAIMRSLDVLLSIPSLLLAMVVLYVMGAHPLVVILVLMVTRVPIFARTVRAQTLEIRERAFMHAATTMGAGNRHLLVTHVAPLVFPMVLAIGTLEFAQVMLAESMLTFLGIGIQPPDVSWGLMVADGRRYLGTAWWEAFWPGLAIASVAVSATILGGWFQTASDPILRKRVGRKTHAAV